jgi:hypothetical protein
MEYNAYGMTRRRDGNESAMRLRNASLSRAAEEHAECYCKFLNFSGCLTDHRHFETSRYLSSVT